MTIITITKSPKGEYKEVSCKGHAGFARAGQDIVCSAVSVLVINTINSIERLTNCQMTVTSEEENGMIKCCFPQKPDEGGRLLLDSMILGLQSIAEEYGKMYLKLKFKEV